MVDLYHASRDDLIRLVGIQGERIADLERQLARQAAELATQQATIADLMAQLGATATGPDADAAASPVAVTAPPQGMPGLKPTQAPERPERPRKRRPHGFGRHRMVPTQRVEHALPQCPDCGCRLSGGAIKRTREVIEVPIVPVTVTEHVYFERRCPQCGRRCVPKPELSGVVVGQSRLGIGLVSLIATLREEGRLPFATIQWYLQTCHGLQLSRGALVGAVATVAAQAKPVVDQLQAAVRASPVVHADETGWRQNGRNGYIWTLSTPTHRYFIRGSRAKAMLSDALGDAFGGVLVSDFYAAYTSYEGLHQFCWAHLLRDIHDLTMAHPQDARVQGWAQAVHTLFARAEAITSDDLAVRRRVQRTLEGELRALCAPYLATEPDDPPPEPERALPVIPPPQATLCRRIDTHVRELFVFVADPAVPPTNNAAERSLRHLVTCRKISGGTRSEAGSTAKTRLASLFGTWRAQGLDPLDQCRQLLTSPQG